MAIARKLMAAAAVSALSLVCAAAFADSTAYADGSRSTVVRTNDLNLNQPRDVARLLQRVSLAADKLCGSRYFGGYLTTAEYRSCYSDTVAHTVANIDRPSVTAYFQQHSSEAATRNLTALQ